MRLVCEFGMEVRIHKWSTLLSVIEHSYLQRTSDCDTCTALSTAGSVGSHYAITMEDGLVVFIENKALSEATSMSTVEPLKYGHPWANKMCPD